MEGVFGVMFCHNDGTYMYAKMQIYVCSQRLPQQREKIFELAQLFWELQTPANRQDTGTSIKGSERVIVAATKIIET